MTRRTSSSSSAPIDCSSSSARSSRGAWRMSKVAAISALSAPARIWSASARAPQSQRQRVHDDGLAGAGFAGEHGQSAREVQLQRVDDGQVA